MSKVKSAKILMHERKKIKQRSSFAFLMRKLVEDEHKKRDPHQEGSEQQENCCAWKVKIPNAMNEYQPSHCHTALMRRSNLLDCFFSLSLFSSFIFNYLLRCYHCVVSNDIHMAEKIACITTNAAMSPHHCISSWICSQQNLLRENDAGTRRTHATR